MLYLCERKKIEFHAVKENIILKTEVKSEINFIFPFFLNNAREKQMKFKLKNEERCVFSSCSNYNNAILLCFIWKGYATIDAGSVKRVLLAKT